jgi:ubiquitin
MEMKTLTKKIVDRLEAEAKKWEHKTAQCEALFMAAKIVAYEFAEEEKKILRDTWEEAQVAHQGDEYINESTMSFKEYYEKTFNTKKK